MIRTRRMHKRQEVEWIAERRHQRSSHRMSWSTSVLGVCNSKFNKDKLPQTMTKRDLHWTRRGCKSCLEAKYKARARAVHSRPVSQTRTSLRPWGLINRHLTPCKSPSGELESEGNIENMICSQLISCKRRITWISISKILKFFYETRKDSSNMNTKRRRNCSEISRGCKWQKLTSMQIILTSRSPIQSILLAILKGLNCPTAWFLKLKHEQICNYNFNSLEALVLPLTSGLLLYKNQMINWMTLIQPKRQAEVV